MVTINPFDWTGGPGSLKNNTNERILSMKMTLFLTALLASLALQAATLAENMKTIALELRTISQNVGNASRNMDSAAGAEKIAQAFLSGKAQLPTTIAELPASEQDQALKRYEQLMQDAANLAQELSVALRENRNQDAQTILTRLLELRKVGHGEFKP